MLFAPHEFDFSFDYQQIGEFILFFTATTKQVVPVGCGTLDDVVVCDLGNPLPSGANVSHKNLSMPYYDQIQAK